MMILLITLLIILLITSWTKTITEIIKQDELEQKYNKILERLEEFEDDGK